jgi:Fic family protein
MLIPPKYTLTPQISALLSSIEGSKEVIDSVAIPPEIEVNIRRQSTLRSSLYSARIEGNELTLDTLHKDPSRTQAKAEVFNALKAVNWLFTRRKKDTSLSEILKLHEIAMSGLVERTELGKLRREMSATFNKAGIAIYLHPAPRTIDAHITRLLKYINSDKERFIPIRAALAHYSFEKIHPFLDGNGRVGRLLIQKILAQGGYGMKGLLAIEEYIDNHRPEYYRALEEPDKDVTEYVEFMLTAISETAQKVKEAVFQKQQFELEDYLLPRRAELLRIIKEQKIINFDSLHRRFLNVNDRTLRYDLKKLQDAGHIRKRGTTRGVYYESSK